MLGSRLLQSTYVFIHTEIKGFVRTCPPPCRYGAPDFIRLWHRHGGGLNLQCSTPMASSSDTGSVPNMPQSLQQVRGCLPACVCLPRSAACTTSALQQQCRRGHPHLSQPEGTRCRSRLLQCLDWLWQDLLTLHNYLQQEGFKLQAGPLARLQTHFGHASQEQPTKRWVAVPHLCWEQQAGWHPTQKHSKPGSPISAVLQVAC